jgi:hypothetical protein
MSSTYLDDAVTLLEAAPSLTNAQKQRLRRIARNMALGRPPELIAALGVEKTAPQWSDEAGHGLGTINARIRAGHAPEQALTLNTIRGSKR